jgi:putative DNA primase/helicase
MYREDITEMVKGKWFGILSQCGIDETFLSGKNTPCPMCGGKDRFAFTDMNDAGVYLCRGCGNGDGWTLLMKYQGIGFAQAVEMVKPIVDYNNNPEIFAKPKTAKRDPVPALRNVAQKTSRIHPSGSVHKYLMSRGFGEIPDGLREAKLDYWADGRVVGTYDTLVSLIQDYEGNGVSYHLTYTKDGKKANLDPARKVMPPKGTISGAAIRLHIDFEDKICIAEGVETAYAAHIDCGLPAFATVSSGGLESFVPPEKVKTVFIYGDNDKSFTGQASAYILAKKLKNKGLDVYVFLPEKVGTDFNDLHMKGLV